MTPTLILTVIVLYFCLLFAVSWRAGRQTDNAGFFSGNRQSNWVLVSFSTIGAAISGVTFVSVPGMVNGAGFSYMQMVLGFTVGQLIVAFVLVPLYYKMNLTSIYEYLRERFGMHTYKTGAWFFFISKLLGASVRLFVVSAVLQLLVFGPLGLPFALNAIYARGSGLFMYIQRWRSLFGVDRFTQDTVSDIVGCAVYYLYLEKRCRFGRYN